jgi:hypothetical protein
VDTEKRLLCNRNQCTNISGNEKIFTIPGLTLSGTWLRHRLLNTETE